MFSCTSLHYYRPSPIAWNSAVDISLGSQLSKSRHRRLIGNRGEYIYIFFQNYSSIGLVQYDEAYLHIFSYCSRSPYLAAYLYFLSRIQLHSILVMTFAGYYLLLPSAKAKWKEYEGNDMVPPLQYSLQ